MDRANGVEGPIYTHVHEDRALHVCHLCVIINPLRHVLTSLGPNELLKVKWEFKAIKIRSLKRVTVHCKIVGKENFKHPISGSEKYQNEFLSPK